MSAVFSIDRLYRYKLTRKLEGGKGTCVFIGLNPSTADETHDDPTIRRCVRFAQEWGYGRLVMLNLYAFRATDPKQMKYVIDPVGPANMGYIIRETKDADFVVCAWGANADPVHENYVMSLLPTAYALGMTKGDHPRHPLYVAANTEPIKIIWRRRR